MHSGVKVKGGKGGNGCQRHGRESRVKVQVKEVDKEEAKRSGERRRKDICCVSDRIFLLAVTAVILCAFTLGSMAKCRSL